VGSSATDRLRVPTSPRDVTSLQASLLDIEADRYFMIRSANNSHGSASRTCATSMNSTTSRRRSPPSYFATKDCGRPSRWAISAWVKFFDLRKFMSKSWSCCCRGVLSDFGMKTGGMGTGLSVNPVFGLSQIGIYSASDSSCDPVGENER